MKPARFSYEAPTDRSPARWRALAARGDEAKIIAGGQSLAPMMNMRLAQPGHLIDINRHRRARASIRVERTISSSAHWYGTRISRAIDWFAQSCADAGARGRHDRPLRDPPARHDRRQPRACRPGGAASACRARARREDRGRLRRGPPHRFRRPSSSSRSSRTALEPDELLVAVHVPVCGQARGWGFRLFARRAGDFALACCVACSLVAPGGRRRQRQSWRSAASVRRRCGSSQRARRRSRRYRLDRAVRRARSRPPRRSRRTSAFSAEYRRELVAALAHDALADAVERVA